MYDTNLLYLREISSDTWDDYRSKANKIGDLYSGTIYEDYSKRIKECSGYLKFDRLLTKSGEIKLKLESVKLCCVRACPICQWRKMLSWRAKAHKVFPRILKEYPQAKFIYLTLTIRSCEVTELRNTIVKLNDAWIKLAAKIKRFSKGWIKAIETSRNKDTNLVHPHLHALVMVSSSYFGEKYISKSKWRKFWKESLRVSYDPEIRIQTIKPLRKPDTMLLALVNTLSYSVKPANLILDSNITVLDREFLIELTSQLYKIKTITTGGVLREYISLLNKSSFNIGDAEDEAALNFKWTNDAGYCLIT